MPRKSNKELGLTPLTRKNCEEAFEWLRMVSLNGIPYNSAAKKYAEVALRRWIKLVDSERSLKIKLEVAKNRLFMARNK